MRNKINAPIILLAVAFLLACAFTSTPAQTTVPQTQTQDTAANQPTQAPNLQTELGLTPDQIQKWRALNQELRPQEIAGKSRVVEAQRALAEAMEAQNPNEELIKQRAKELADAQSVMTQLRALRQARVLQMLTPEQRIKLKEIQHTQALLHQQQAPNGAGPRQQLKRPNAQLLTPTQRKALKQQQRQKPKR